MPSESSVPPGQRVSNDLWSRFTNGVGDMAENRDSYFTTDQAFEIVTGDYEANRLDPSRKYEIDLNRKDGPLRSLYDVGESTVFSYPLDLAQSQDSDATHFMQFSMYEVQSPNLRDQARLNSIIKENPLNEDDNSWLAHLDDDQIRQMGYDPIEYRTSMIGMSFTGRDPTITGFYGQQAPLRPNTGFDAGPFGKKVLENRLEELKEDNKGYVMDLKDDRGKHLGTVNVEGNQTRVRTPNPTRTLRQKKYKSKDTCFLYMPHKINNLSLQSYDTPSLLFAAIIGQAGTAATEAVRSAIKGNYGESSSALMEVVNSMGPAMARKLIAAGDSVASVIGIDTELEAAATQLLGQAVNPRKELVYNTPELRTFEFSYEFYPRNVKESQMVEAIIKLFRFHSAPSLADGGNFLVPPSIFAMKFYQRTSTSVAENPFLLKIRDCALTEVNVDFTPNGTFSTFGNGAPVAINMSLTFKELDINVKDDILEGY